MERSGKVAKWVTVWEGPAGELLAADAICDIITTVVGEAAYDVRILIDGRPLGEE